MNARSMTVRVLALAILAASGGVALAQAQLPEGWIPNWDGSGTYVYLGSPGTGNVGYKPGSFDVSADRYGERHPGWHDQLMVHITQDWYRQNHDRAGGGWQERLSPDEEGRLRPGQQLEPGLRQRMHWAPPDLAQRYGTPPPGYRYAVIGGHVLLLDNDYRMRQVYRIDVGPVAPVEEALPAGWIQNWDGSGTYVFLGSPGTGNVGYKPGSFDVSADRYSERHPGWHDQLMVYVTQDWYRQNHDRAGGGWQERLSPDEEARLRPGQRLDPELRQRTHGLPPELSQRYRTPPPGYRYAVIGGHVLLLDGYNQIYEVYRIDVGPVAPPEAALPAGWIENWDGSGTYVFLGSPGTGNVGHKPGSFDIPAARYSERHPGWHDQLMVYVTQDWYRQNQDRAGGGWHDQLSPDEESRLRPGQRLDPHMRQRAHWLPADLSQRYRTPPPGYRYAVIGGRVVLLDSNYQVYEVYRVDVRDR